MHDFHQAEDIVQNVFLSFWKDRNSIEINESVRAYLFRSVHNRCLDALKHREVILRHNFRSNADNPSCTEETWETFVEAELYIILLKAMDKLPAECRKVFRYSRIDLLSHKEIAEKLGLSVKTVENQIGKALRILREALKDYLPAWLMIF